MGAFFWGDKAPVPSHVLVDGGADDVGMVLVDPECYPTYDHQSAYPVRMAGYRGGDELVRVELNFGSFVYSFTRNPWMRYFTRSPGCIFGLNSLPNVGFCRM